MISLCMIIRDEEQRLRKCLLSVKGLVDEIIIVDTGSDDRSKEIAYMFTDKVYDYAWDNDFSKARNFALSKATNEWVLVLDADENVTSYNKNQIKRFCESSPKIVGRIEINNLFEDEFGTKKYCERVSRFFNIKEFMYKGKIHEQVISKGYGEYRTRNIEIAVDHVGYSKEFVDLAKKTERNLILLTEEIKEEKSDPYLYYQLGKSYFISKIYNEAYKNFKEALALIKRFDYEYVEDLIESLGYCMINLQLYQEAFEIYKYEKYYSNSPQFIFLLGLIEMNNGNFKKSAENFLRCTEFEKGKVEGITTWLPLYNIGVIFESLNLKEEAKQYYEMCLDYRPAILRLKNI